MTPAAAPMDPRGPTRGRLIAFEGGEASGKSTQTALLAARIGAVLTREPGGTELGEQIRAVLLDPSTGDLDPRTELLMMTAARAEHVARVIAPTLAAGGDVVSDRFSGSSLAYQGYGRGLDVTEVARVSTWATAGIEPDLVVLLDVPDEVRRERLGDRLDRLEAAGRDFHERVVAGFRSLAADHPDRWFLVDGTEPVESLGERIAAEVAARLGLPRG